MKINYSPRHENWPLTVLNLAAISPKALLRNGIICTKNVQNIHAFMHLKYATKMHFN